MNDLALAIAAVARSTSLEELGAFAMPWIGRALRASPSFFAVSSERFVESTALAGEQRSDLSGYLRDFMREDPLIHAAVARPTPVSLFVDTVDPRTLYESRAYAEFHRPRDLEHHLLLRFAGERLTTPGALSMGFTRGRRSSGFGSSERASAELICAALRGAAERLALSENGPRCAQRAEIAGAEYGLSNAETRVLAILLLGQSNREIAQHLYVSVDTVKTHVQRIFAKLGVRSRARAIALVGEGSHRHVGRGEATPVPFRTR